jgi:hypothetical protein
VLDDALQRRCGLTSALLQILCAAAIHRCGDRAARTTFEVAKVADGDFGGERPQVGGPFVTLTYERPDGPDLDELSRGSRLHPTLRTDNQKRVDLAMAPSHFVEPVAGPCGCNPSIPDSVAEAHADDRAGDAHRESSRVPALERPGKYLMSLHTFVVESESLRIVVDTCNGNSKTRPPIPEFDHQDRPFLDDLGAAGFAPDRSTSSSAPTRTSITWVGIPDLVDGDWIPTFPVRGTCSVRLTSTTGRDREIPRTPPPLQILCGR